MSEMAPKTTYNSSCHCGNAQFTFALDAPLEEKEVTQCNCSICTANGYLLVYPDAADIQFNHPEDAVKGYRFGTGHFPHYFCVNCGSSLYVKCENPEMGNLVAVNVRSIPNLDVKTLKIKFADGRSS